MKSHLTKQFIKSYKLLPERIRKLAKKSYKVWQEHPNHPGLNFKNIANNIYSVRIGIGWRALGVIQDGNIIWFWIGSHSDYDKLIDSI